MRIYPPEVSRRKAEKHSLETEMIDLPDVCQASNIGTEKRKVFCILLQMKQNNIERIFVEMFDKFANALF